MWQPADDAVTVVTGYGDLTPQPTAVVGRGLVFPAPTDQLANQGLIGQVDRRGYWQRVARVPDAGGHWSLDGTEVAFTVGEDGEIGTKSPRVGMVVDATQRHRVTMSFPRAYVVSGAIWESNDDVRDSGGWILLIADQSGDIDRGEQYLLRCNATTGDCAVALRYQGGPNWQFPSVQ
jgi:hypothetical protein